MNPSSKINIIEYRNGLSSETSDTVVSEKRLKIFSNNKEVLSLLCTPTMVRELVVGFVLSEGFTGNKTGSIQQEEWCSERIEIFWKDEEIEVNLPLDIPEGIAALTSGCGKGITFLSDTSEEKISEIKDNTVVNPGNITGLYKDFQKRSELFRTTGGVHSAALCNEKEIIVFADDIGRHNAVDKIIGYSFLENISPEGKILLLSGRLSSEITLKAVKFGVPVLISRAAPTDMSVEIARRSKITMIGFLRGNNMNIYSGPERIKK